MAFKPQPIKVPEPQQVRFEKSPLSLVVFQLRFEHLGAPSDEHLRALKDALSDYPAAHALQNVQIQVGAPGAQASSDRGMRFSTLDGDWAVTLLPDSVALESTAYADWEDFSERVRTVLAAVQDALAPRVEVRLGLRYVNELKIDSVKVPLDWSSYLRPELTAMTASDLLAPASFNAQQTIQLDAGNGATINFRHGFPGARDGSFPESVYLLDFDCFREGQRALEADEVLAEAASFNQTMTALFQWCISDQLWKELDPHDK